MDWYSNRPLASVLLILIIPLFLSESSRLLFDRSKCFFYRLLANKFVVAPLTRQRNLPNDFLLVHIFSHFTCMLRCFRNPSFLIHKCFSSLGIPSSIIIAQWKQKCSSFCSSTEDGGGISFALQIIRTIVICYLNILRNSSILNNLIIKSNTVYAVLFKNLSNSIVAIY